MSSPANPTAEQAVETKTTETAEVSLLDQIVAQGRFGKDTLAQERGKDMVKEFVNQVLEGHMTLTRDAEATIGARVAEIDRLVSLQLNEVLHHPSFQKLEATWRGIKHLLEESETSEMLKIKVLNVSKKDLLRDLQRVPEFDQSAFFKKVYEEEFGVFGGSPFGALVGDFEFGRSGEDIELLERVAMRNRAREPVRTLSRGMVQRVAIARAVLHDPELLLLDEPYANLDPAAIELVRPLIGAEAGRTRVIFSHDPAGGLAEADLVLGLRAGRTVLLGGVRDIGLDEITELYR